MVGVIVVMGFVVVGLVIYTITGVFTLSLNGTFLVALLIDLAILLIEVRIPQSRCAGQKRHAAHAARTSLPNFVTLQGLSVVLAYSLTKDLDPKRVGTAASFRASFSHVCIAPLQWSSAAARRRVISSRSSPSRRVPARSRCKP
jgi:hypothetical protein